MKKPITFRESNGELNIPRIGGKSFLPNDLEWPTNPDGEKLTLVLSLPAIFLNSILQFDYPSDKVISVFTTYNPDDYFLHGIVYHGDTEELGNIKSGFTKVILHSVGTPRNDSDFLIPAHEIVVDVNTDNEHGTFLGGEPVLLQNEKLEIGSAQFCMQIYGGDFPTGFQNIFYLSDSTGYLFLDKEENASDIGLFFTQCT